MRARIVFAPLVARALLVAASDAGVVYSFSNITNNNPSNVNVAPQLRMTVSDGGSFVSFAFDNAATVSSSVARIFFDSNDALGALLRLASPFPSLSYSSGVQFSRDANPGTLPGGNSLGFDTDYSVSARNPKPSWGLNDANDLLTIKFTLAPSASHGDVLAALDSGALRVGMHVIAIGQASKSDGFLNNPNTNAPPTLVPAPAAGLLGVIGLGLLGLRRPARA